jgi:hypothetical protein
VDRTVGSEEHPDALCGFARLTDRKKLEEWGFKPREVMDIAIQGERRSALRVQKKPEAEQRRRDGAVASAMTFTWGFVSRPTGLSLSLGAISNLNSRCPSSGTLRSSSRKHPRSAASVKSEEATSGESLAPRIEVVGNVVLNRIYVRDRF